MFTKLKTLVAISALTLAVTSVQAAETVKIGLVVKALGIGFFEAAHEGAKEAAAEMGDIEVIYTGPTTTTAEGQIETINALIAQKVDAIAVSANDGDALVPILKKAKSRGIKVISWDSGVADEGRILHLNPSSNALIGAMCVQLADDAVKATGAQSGEVAILSATPTSTNQNIWIEEMKKTLKAKYPNLTLVATVYGDDLSDKSYREAVGLMKSYPNLKAIIAPTTVGILAAAQAVEDQKMVGKIFVTGLGLPSELAGHVDLNSIKSFAIWNPIDLGYTATMLAYNLVKGNGTASSVPMGRMGTAELDATGNAAMSDPFIYDASNVHQFADIF